MEDLYQIIKDCAAENRLSQEKLYRRFYPKLFLLCKRFFKDDHQALEVLNDGMLKVYKNISTYKTEKGNFFNWMYTVILHTAIDKIKVIAKENTVELTDHARIIYPDNPLKTLDQKDMYRLLDMLAPATRAVCSLFYLEGFTINHIAEKLELSIGTVKWHLHDARKRMKPILEKHYL